MTRRIPRWLARAPIPLYRRGFGWLLGKRILMLEHHGRLTGQLRCVTLEVVDREPGALIVVSGYGSTAQWFRNVIANPNVRVWNSRIRGRPGHATVIPAKEVPGKLESYRRRHPRAAKALGRTLGIADLADSQPLPDDIGERLPLVQITLDS